LIYRHIFLGWLDQSSRSRRSKIILWKAGQLMKGMEKDPTRLLQSKSRVGEIMEGPPTSDTHHSAFSVPSLGFRWLPFGRSPSPDTPPPEQKRAEPTTCDQPREHALPEVLFCGASCFQTFLPCPRQLYLLIAQELSCRRGAQMARRPQPPWWWRTEVLARMAMTLASMVTAVYLAKLLTTYL
jgi:hypothetical protein